jgi:Cu(I)/Ag(I) efflux system protein CusF
MKVAHLITALGLAVAIGDQAQSAPAATRNQAAQRPVAGAAAPTTDGEVRKIDKEQGKLTLMHGPIQNLDMPGMTMVFKVADPGLLDQVKVGDKVKFAAESRNGALTVTAIKPAP